MLQKIKSHIIRFDDKLCGGKYRELWNKGANSRNLRNFISPDLRSYVQFYEPSLAVDFNALCDKYGSDKGSNNLESAIYSWNPHKYGDFYATAFVQNRQKVKNIFECGIGTNTFDAASSMGRRGIPGASLRV